MNVLSMIKNTNSTKIYNHLRVFQSSFFFQAYDFNTSLLEVFRKFWKSLNNFGNTLLTSLVPNASLPIRSARVLRSLSAKHQLNYHVSEMFL